MMTLKNKLKELQKAKKMNDQQFADELGITREWWNQIKNGHRKVSNNIAINAMNSFPEITGDVIAHLQRRRK